jgi:hypothetical protein
MEQGIKKVFGKPGFGKSQNISKWAINSIGLFNFTLFT